ncbi:class I SAM-dependent methyltransferase [Actinomadura yumaensis]|uniref:class I SAM-dependent methyltransferase n=1 Tax=Actinomadura yumaensis TaxID=111807 RepID=UPI00360BF6BB
MDTIEIQRIAEVEDESWWYRERRAAVARELRRIGTPGRAVDIGAAGGGNTRVLAAHGWDAVAVDGSPAAVRLARARGVEAYEGDAAYLPLPSGHFDFAMALDVLEHVEDDRAAAAEMARVLRPGGTALVSVACDLSLWSAHDVVLGRVRRYSRRALAEVIEGRASWSTGCGAGTCCCARSSAGGGTARPAGAWSVSIPPSTRACARSRPSNATFRSSSSPASPSSRGPTVPSERRSQPSAVSVRRGGRRRPSPGRRASRPTGPG